MTTPTPAQRRESKAKQRRLQKEREPLQRALRHVQALEQALSRFPGTVIVVSHDRDFLQGLGTEVIVLGSDRH